ncbi:carboxypeptidase regulatory-like domain-containing protein [Streptomyces sp. SL13]|uniref:alpha-amylase n=1 Tax=Streptantibioticus silvisoli TaxID=2705255 RepID=A0AA90KIS9_9ACTN|nr:carboxypeptidase regulatory-like domain-containing protein [Streptantibioticus silvisoli]MDI5972974.1 carboxypeptidase regulatory-like domain-containing protein [Streptantibioticus silvisoli]
MADGSRGWTREVWDRVVASDPGLNRLRMALSAALAMASTMALEYGFARATHAGAQGTLVAMLLGTIMAMMGSMALAGAETWPKVRTAVFFPVAIGAGMLIGVSVTGRTDLMLCVFVAVMFVAVYVRRFGMPFFFYGFMLWMGYFFAAFLGATVSAVPSMLEAVCVATAWVLLLACTVLRTNTRRTLGRVRRAFGARARAVARACADLLEADRADARRQERLRRTLHARQLRLAEAALMIEGWSAEPGALPAGAGPALRRRLLDAHLAVDALAVSAEALATEGGPMVAPAARIAGLVARREYAAAEALARPLLTAPGTDTPGRPAGPSFDAAGHLDDAAFDAPGAPQPGEPGDSTGTAGDGHWPAHHLAAAVVEFTTLSAEPPLTRTAPAARSGPGAGDSAEDAVLVAESVGEYEPTLTLIQGMLPGSASVAGDVKARGHHWNPLSRSSLVTRQAIQVAVAGTLAIIAGRELSEARYYWAVLAAFIAFAGTATRSETTIKAANRVGGTLVGLGAGIGLAHLTAGHTYWVLAVIVASMSCGFYLVNISYGSMIFFVTIMVSQLYSVLHEFSAGLLVLRLEETSIGAAIGIGVAIVVLPTSTRDTVSTARQRYFAALSDVLRACARRLEPATATANGPVGEDGTVRVGAPVRDQAGADAELEALTRTLDHRLQQLALVARPLTRPLVWRNDPRQVRHRLTLFASVTRHTRALALAPRRLPEAAHDDSLAVATRSLAEAAGVLAGEPPAQGRPAPDVASRLTAADAALFAHRPRCAPAALPPVSRPLHHLRQLLHELALVPGTLAVPPAPAPAPAAGAVRRAGTADLAVLGLVRGSAGLPVAGAAIAVTEDDGRQSGRTVTGEDGRFALDVPGPGTYLLIGSAEGHAPQAVTVVVRTRSADVSLLLASRGGVAGTVLDAAAGTPVAGAELTVDGERDRPARTAVTGADGGYHVDGLPPGRHTLTVRAGGRRVTALPVDVPRPADGTAADGVPPVRCDVRLAPGARVGGTVRGRSGAPVPQARVTLIDGAGAMIGSATTDGQGRFALADVAPGDYTMITRTHTCGTHPPAAEPLSVREDGAEGLDLRLGGTRSKD